MKSQATRYTRKELAYLAYWEARGYRFKRGQKPPLSTDTPPGFAVSNPILDALCGLFIIVFVTGLCFTWVYYAAGFQHG
ncbi:hypothetical protein G169_gp43 [Pseudomonas phage AF]|uniref:hypothetical protein n=1 Tax=Pseudomonas phage AF TaxID=1235689 RepID=UPI000297161F|nr:hypothetical protein G169_gp43 [Pseudomonas phage AF]AFV50656.1 hypothetical protein AF_043 [Pseudomonas phage AF]